MTSSRRRTPYLSWIAFRARSGTEAVLLPQMLPAPCSSHHMLRVTLRYNFLSAKD